MAQPNTPGSRRLSRRSSSFEDVVLSRPTRRALAWTGLLACSVASVWKVADLVAEFSRREMGTNVEIVATAKVALPAFAVCRHHKQIHTFWDSSGVSLLSAFNVSFSSLESLSSMRALGEERFQRVAFARFLFNDSRGVKGVKVAPRSSSSAASDSSDAAAFVSSPEANANEWNTFFHPVHGVCLSFEASASSPLTSLVGTAGAASVRVSLDFDRLFPWKQDAPTSASVSASASSSALRSSSSEHPHASYVRANTWITQQQKLRLEKDLLHGDRDLVEASNAAADGYNEAVVAVFSRHSFLTSAQMVAVSKFRSEFHRLGQEIMDRSGTKTAFHCNDEKHYSEDSCLSECLLTKFRAEFGCVHPRLRAMLDGGNAHLRGHAHLAHSLRPLCTHEQLGAKNKDGLAADDTDVGLIRIVDLLAGFNEHGAAEARCHCQEPCLRHTVSLHPWKSEDTIKPPEFVHFELDGELKSYRYHFRKSANDLLADVGGSLGLFLGVSFLGVVQQVTAALKRRGSRIRRTRTKARTRDDAGQMQAQRGQAPRKKKATKCFPTRRSLLDPRPISKEGGRLPSLSVE